MPRAVVITGEAVLEVQDVAKPSPAENEILVRVHAAGLNPGDWKMVHMFGSKLIGKTPGYDFAGTVEELGVGVPAGAHYIGQRVAGAVLDGRGAFAEYLVVDAGLIWEIPDGVGYEVAATQTAPALTACQMLWQSHDGFPTPEHPGDGQTPVLVWSAASGVGHWLTQLAHNSGLRVFATASPKHTERLKTLGAVDVFDYRDPEAGAKIHAATSGKLAYVGVCEAAQADVPNIVDALGRGGGTLALAAAPLQAPPGADKPINAVFSVVFTLLGKPITGIFEIPAMPEHRAAATTYLARIATLLRDGKVATLPVRVFGGLDSVGDAMQELRAGKVSGERIAFRVFDDSK